MAGAAPRPGASQATVTPPDCVQMASDGKKLQDVYVPIQLFGHKAIAMLDSGAEKTIIGARLLPDGVKVRPTTHTLLAANGTSIQVKGEYNVYFKVAGRKFNICAVVTRSVHEFILGIDFLSKNVSAWDFGTGHVRVRNLWVHLQRRSPKPEHRYVFNSDKSVVVAPCTQVDARVDIARLTWRSTDCNSWVTQPLEIADGVVTTRTLFGVEDAHTVVRVLNLTDKPYKLKPNQFLGTASPVKGPGCKFTSRGGNCSSTMIDNLRVDFTTEQRELAVRFVRDNEGGSSRFG